MKYVSLGLLIVAFSLGVGLHFFRPPESSLEQSSEVELKILGTCKDCQIAKDPPNTIQIESPTKCTKDRVYFQNSLKKIDPVFLNARNEKGPAEFPISCTGYVMRKFMDASATSSRYYSNCPRAFGMPSRPMKTHCVTEEYVNAVYNSYVDVMDCLDIPQKDLIPKLYNESGFHINTLGSGMDAGIGQLTSPAIASVQQLASFDGQNKTWLQMFKEEISQSDKPSCQRIAKIKSLFDKISIDTSQRCALIAAPENPLKNILYTGIFYHYILRSQTGARYFKGYTYLPKGNEYVRFDRNNRDLELEGMFAEYKIKERIRELGIDKPNMQALKQMMVTLGYNSGMQSAFIFLDRYLKARTTKKAKLTPSDFDFQTKFYSDLVRRNPNPDVEKQRLKDLAVARTAPYLLSFPVYLRMVQRVGTPGYLSLVANKLNLLDKEMGEGLCTTSGFLRF